MYKSLVIAHVKNKKKDLIELKHELGFQTPFIKFDSELPEPAVEPITVDSGTIDTYEEPKEQQK